MLNVNYLKKKMDNKIIVENEASFATSKPKKTKINFFKKIWKWFINLF